MPVRRSKFSYTLYQILDVKLYSSQITTYSSHTITRRISTVITTSFQTIWRSGPFWAAKYRLYAITVPDSYQQKEDVPSGCPFNFSGGRASQKVQLTSMFIFKPKVVEVSKGKLQNSPLRATNKKYYRDTLR